MYGESVDKGTQVNSETTESFSQVWQNLRPAQTLHRDIIKYSNFWQLLGAQKRFSWCTAHKEAIVIELQRLWQIPGNPRECALQPCQQCKHVHIQNSTWIGNKEHPPRISLMCLLLADSPSWKIQECVDAPRCSYCTNACSLHFPGSRCPSSSHNSLDRGPQPQVGHYNVHKPTWAHSDTDYLLAYNSSCPWTSKCTQPLVRNHIEVLLDQDSWRHG